jgi:hypothetical protein
MNMSIDIKYFAFDAAKADKKWDELLPNVERLRNQEPERGGSEEDFRIHDWLNNRDPNQRDRHIQSLDLMFGDVASGVIEEGKKEYGLVEILSEIFYNNKAFEPTRDLILKTADITEEQKASAVEAIKQEFDCNDDDALYFLSLYIVDTSAVARSLKANPNFFFIVETNGEVHSADPRSKTMLNERLESLRNKIEKAT